MLLHYHFQTKVNIVILVDGDWQPKVHRSLLLLLLLAATERPSPVNPQRTLGTLVVGPWFLVAANNDRIPVGHGWTTPPTPPTLTNAPVSLTHQRTD